MKITMYELLGLVKNGKAPKKIKYRDKIWEYTSTINGKGYQYYSKGYEEWKTLQNQVYLEECLNDEIEIIEEPKPITKESIEALGYACGEIRKCFENGWNKSLENKPLIEEPKKIEKIDFRTLNTQKEKNRAMKDAINKLIDEINNLKEND